MGHNSGLKNFAAWSLAAFIAAIAPFAAAQSTRPSGDLASMSLEDLMNVQVTSVSKSARSVSEAPAAITVITQEDIRRSGLESIPELMRLVPGLEVARFNANQWAISARGFNDLYANKLLVLMDGRTIYYPVFGGVFWDTVDYILPDLDRIEVIRGPGATLWGSNAVNGVINIMTKPADQTQGWLTRDAYSSQGYDASIRYGGKLDDQTYYRIYGKGTDTDDFKLTDGSDAHDGWNTWRTGFRIDRYTDADNTFTLQGDFFQERAGQMTKQWRLAPPFLNILNQTNDTDGQYILARWTHVHSPQSDSSLQFYYDRLEHGDYLFGFTQHTLDVDFQQRFALAKSQELIWGLSGRVQWDAFSNRPEAFVDPKYDSDYILSAFVQDDITLVTDRLHLIAGSKLEYNDQTHLEFEPSLRLLYTPDKKQSFWASVSHAVRLPTRIEGSGHLFVGTFPSGTGTGALTLNGSPDIDSEKLTAFELGYRFKPTDRVMVDVAGFANIYRELRAAVGETPFFDGTATPPHSVVPLVWHNKASAETYGVETSANWNITDNWRLSGSHTFLTVSMHNGGEDEIFFEGSSPRNQLQFHSYYNITKQLEINAGAYWVQELGNGVPSYTRVDAGIIWRPKPGLELSLGVQNLLDNQHPEFEDSRTATNVSEVPRTVYGQLSWKF